MGSYALYTRNRARVPSGGVRDPLRRLILVGGTVMGVSALGAYGLYAFGVRRSTEQMAREDGCIEGDVALYDVNVLPRSLGVTAKMEGNSYSPNKHALWGASHLTTGVVAEVREHIRDPKEVMTNALLLEATYSKYSVSHISNQQKVVALAQFVIDMTTSITLKPQLLDDGDVALVPLENTSGNVLQYHPQLAPEGLEKYNPVDRWGALRIEGYINYSRDVLQTV